LSWVGFASILLVCQVHLDHFLVHVIVMRHNELASWARITHHGSISIAAQARDIARSAHTTDHL